MAEIIIWLSSSPAVRIITVMNIVCVYAACFLPGIVSSKILYFLPSINNRVVDIIVVDASMNVHGLTSMVSESSTGFMLPNRIFPRSLAKSFMAGAAFSCTVCPITLFPVFPVATFTSLMSLPARNCE